MDKSTVIIFLLSAGNVAFLVLFLLTLNKLEDVRASYKIAQHMWNEYGKQYKPGEIIDLPDNNK